MIEEQLPEARKSPRADVPRYYRVACRFFEDEKVRRWTLEVKFLALYLLTNKHRNLEGFYILPPPYIASDLGWSLRRVMKGVESLIKDEFILFDRAQNLLLIRNALRYQQPDSPNVQKAIISRVKNLPQNSELLKAFILLAHQHCSRKGLTACAQGLPVLLCKEFNISIDGL